MLPNFETCRKHILAYKRRVKTPRPDTINFPRFWDYKTGLESAGENILDEKNIENTALKLKSLLKYFRIRNSNLAEKEQIKRILSNIHPYYAEICGVTLGSGKIHTYRNQIESMYERLGGVMNGEDKKDHRLSAASKSTILMAIWGQVPRLDVLNRRRFEIWTHWPAPEKLPHLKAKEIWYRPDEFAEMVEELDKWVIAWPTTNYSKSFLNSFGDLCPGIPPGRQIDIIYHWKLPETWVDYRMQTQGSGIVTASDNSIDEFCGGE